MTLDEKVRLASEANESGRQSRYGGAPILSAQSTAEQIADWLQWNDPNGAHTPWHAEAEGADFYTLSEAWDALKLMLTDA